VFALSLVTHAWRKRLFEVVQRKAPRGDCVTRRAKLGCSGNGLGIRPATLLLEQGAHMKAVEEILGHSGLNTTANVYAHVLPSYGWRSRVLSR